jgi:hypothetical protein
VSGIGVAELERDVDDPSAGIAAHSLRHVEVRPRDDACEADTIGALRTLADRQHQEGRFVLAGLGLQREEDVQEAESGLRTRVVVGDLEPPAAVLHSNRVPSPGGTSGQSDLSECIAAATRVGPRSHQERERHTQRRTRRL